jgi:mandelate racemase
VRVDLPRLTLRSVRAAHWLEYVDWMNSLLTAPLAVVDGLAAASDRPGIGLAWNDEMVRRYASA